MVSPPDTPETVIFRDSTFFRKFGSAAKLPSPEEVRTEGAIQHGARPGACHQKPVFFEQLGLVVKWGGYERVEEAHCMRMVRMRCGALVPVPEIYGWIREPPNAIHPHFPQVFIYMERIPGVTLEERAETLREQEVDYIVRQLIEMFKTLREIRPLPDMEYVGKIPLNQCGINKTPLPDIYLEGWENAGPFPDVKSFHDWYSNLTNQLSGSPPSTDDPQRQCLPDDSPIIFTHGDLNLVNIIVSSPGDGPARVLAIIDWHQSGWYPAYWEFCKAICQGTKYPGWRECLEAILAPHNKSIEAWDYYARAAGY